jgi:hypothetical protein
MLSESLGFCLNIEDVSRTSSPIPFDLFDWHSWAMPAAESLRRWRSSDAGQML